MYAFFHVYTFRLLEKTIFDATSRSSIFYQIRNKLCSLHPNIGHVEGFKVIVIVILNQTFNLKFPNVPYQVKKLFI